MRKLLITLLLASAAATSALAAPDDDVSAREQARAERQQAREQARADRSSREERVEASRPERAERAERAIETRQSYDGPARGDAVARARAGDIEAIRAAREARRDSADALREQRLQQRGMAAPSTERQRGSVFRDRIEQRRQEVLDRVATRRAPLPVSRVPREGTQPPLPTVTRSTPAPQWSSSWRHDNKYDWYNWRKRNRWLFHLGFYHDPFGWGYRPYSIGWRMWPSYYGSSYWLNDPWRYRLPYAPPGYRWVRYWDDAVLVDTWTGEVVDVIYNFFW